MINTSGDISFRTAGFVAGKMLEAGQHVLVTERFGQFDPQGRNKSKTRKFRRIENLPRAIAPLAEGIPPAGRQVTFTDIECSLEEYGDYVKLSDVILDTHEDMTLQEMAKKCGRQAAETVEEVRINVLKGGSNVVYANGVASRTLVTSPATVNDFRKIARAFARNKAGKISQIISATAKVATEPVAAGYFVMGHTDCHADLRNLSGFVPVEQYSDAMKALPNEVGKLEEFRFILTAMFTPWEAAGVAGTTYLSGGVKPGSSLACDVYPLIVVAEDAYALVPLQGENAIQPFVVNPKPSSHDPLAQQGHVGWKTYQAAVILNQLWLTRLEVAATAL